MQAGRLTFFTGAGVVSGATSITGEVAFLLPLLPLDLGAPAVVVVVSIAMRWLGLVVLLVPVRTICHRFGVGSMSQSIVMDGLYENARNE